MPTIEVDGATAALLHESRDIIQNLITGKSASKMLVCPEVNPDGTEVKSVQEAAALMGVSDVVAARAILESELGDEAKNDALDVLEEKAVRHVRTPAGVKKFGQPIGSIIVRDGANPLKNITVAKKNTFDGAMTVEGGGKKFAVLDDEGTWIAIPEDSDPDTFWDNAVVKGKTEEEVLTALDKHVAPPSGSRASKDKAPAKKPLSKAPTGGSNADKIKNAETMYGTDSPQHRAAIAKFGDKKPEAAKPKEVKPGNLAKGRQLLDEGYDDPGTWDNFVTGMDPVLLDALEAAAKEEGDATVLRAIKKARGAGTAKAPTKSEGFDASKLKRNRQMPLAHSVKPGDYVAPSWAAEHPYKVTKTGPITKTGRVTVYFEMPDGTTGQQTYKMNERLIGFGSAEGN